MESQGSLNLDAVNLTYTWNFSGFNNLSDYTTGKKITSVFKVSLYNTTLWRVSVYSNGVDDNSKNYVSLFIYLIDSKKYPIEATFVFSILNSEKKKCNKLSCKKIFEGIDEGVGTYQFTSTSNFDKHVINGKFTIICEISMNLSQVQTANMNTLSVVEACINNLSDDFKKLIGDEESSDVSFNVSGQAFKAHKCILSKRSSVFAALFKHDMKESHENSVDIEETEADVFKEMLHFVYTAKVEHLDKLAFELLSLSDRYGLLDLKQLCALHLHDNLTVDNALDIYLLSDRHNSKELKTAAFNFIISNIKSIIDTPKFKTLENNNPSLVAEILRTIVTKSTM